ncbi:MAG: hypothetical protein M0P39_02230 [Rhodocyclaceae bacterium]|jgi:hypothetical protein|nr:hypothetical protein [Rhodocyclaceae bacterium]
MFTRPLLTAVALTILASGPAWAEEENAADVSASLPAELPAAPSLNACKLLAADALAAWGFGAEPAARADSRVIDKDHVASPGNVRADICSFDNDKEKLPARAFLVVESFTDDVTGDAVAGWLKTVSDKIKPADKLGETRIGDATCETGNYPVATKAGEDPVTLHFVACDRQAGRRHVSFNFEWPGADPKLPSTNETKALLDQAIASLPTAP